MATITGDNTDNILTGTDSPPAPITLVSADAAGVLANNTSQNPVFSPDNTMVAFASKADNLVAGDTNGEFDIFLKNLVTGEITLVSADATGQIGNQRSLEPTFSPDGTKIAFSSRASNLVAGDTNNARDLFVKDIATGAITRVATDTSGGQGDGASFNPVFSPDGSKILFYSWAGLDPHDNNALRDIYVKDLASGETTLVSQAADGSIANKQSIDAFFSPDGTHVVFASIASNLVAGDNNDEKDIFIKDLATGEVTLVSTGSAGEQGNDESGQYYTAMAFSADGTKVAFSSEASNFVAGDVNDAPDIFVKNLVTGEIVCASTSASGEIGNDDSGQWEGTIQFSPDGTKLLFASAASNLVAGDTNGKVDIFVKDLVTGQIMRVNTDATGLQSNGDAARPEFSPDGTMIVFRDSGDNLVSGDNNGHADIFVKLLPVDGNDVIDGGAGNDVISGLGGDDVLNGGAGNDTMDGGAGFDTADYGDASAGVTVTLGTSHAQDTIGAGIDSLSNIEAVSGSAFADSLHGSRSDNILSGRGGDDTLHGGAGRDTLVGGAGNDVLSGGDGIDTASYQDAGAGVVVSLDVQGAQDTGASGFDTLGKIENLTGSYYGDVLGGSGGANLLLGSSGDDVLLGRGGNDVLMGGAGNDVMLGGAGNDRMDGGVGDDIVSYADATSAVSVYLFPDKGDQDTGGAGIDVLHDVEGLIGSRYDDNLSDGHYLDGGDGNDILHGASGSDSLIGGTGNDAIYGANGQDSIDGGAGNDLIDGGDDDDVAAGGAGSDTLFGKGGADSLDGGGDNDSLTGGLGADTLTGGHGADRFIYLSAADSGPDAASRDIITDFKHGTDVIDVSAIDAIAGVHNSVFAFVAGGFTHHAGQLTAISDVGGVVVLGDTNGDGVGDFSIFVAGTASVVAGDFAL